MDTPGKVACFPRAAARSKERKLTHRLPQVGQLRRMKPHPPRGRKFQHTQRTAVAESTSITMSPTTESRVKGQSGTPAKLAESLHLLDSIFVRNKNQHRSQAWWKPFSLLRNALRKFTTLEMRESELKNPVRTEADVQVVDSRDVRRRFELEAQVRRERENVGEWIRETLCPWSYVTFSSLVADTQFANLGVVLVGAVSEIAGVVGLPQGSGTEVDECGYVLQGAQVATRQARSLTAHSLQVTGTEKGTLVERIYDSDDLGEVVERQGDSPQIQEPPQLLQTGNDTRRSSVSRGAEDSAGEATTVSMNAQLSSDNQLQDGEIEVGEDSAALDASGAVAAGHKRPAGKVKKSAAQHLASQNQAKPMPEKPTKKFPISSQPAPATTPLPPPLPGKVQIATTSSTSNHRTSTKSTASLEAAGMEVSRKQKRLNDGDSSELLKNRTKKTTERSSSTTTTTTTSSKSQKRKKRNAIDDMFAGFG
jgi:hypothetical protein